MSLDFYNTVGGKRFIEGTIPTLSKNIENLSKNLSKKVIQEAKIIKCDDIVETLNSYFLEGYRMVSISPYGIRQFGDITSYLVILEKDE